VPQELTAAGRARDAAARAAWAEAYELLHPCDDAGLEPEDFEALADAAWWLCRVEESLAARHKAYQAYVAADNARRAGYSAWMLSSEYHFLGKDAVSAGWLRRAQRHLRDEPECVEQGFVTFAEAEVAELQGDLDGALALARRMTEIGQRCGSRDLIAMGTQTQGRLLIAKGQLADGLAMLDEVMCDVTAGALSDLATGWIYCLAVAVCFDTADLRRATEWNEAAMAWCESLPAGTPFHGLCRVHRVELMGLRGAWDEASSESVRACDELMSYHPNMAGESFYVAGEIRRRMGDLAAAEQAFLQALDLGRDPQPGLALLRLSQGKTGAAAAALRSCLASNAWNPLARARLLAAQVEVALATGELEAARAAAGELDAIAGASGADLLEALAVTARGALHLADGEVGQSLDRLRRGRALWLELGLPYEAAQARMLLATASRAAGDDETARLELRAARSVFERLGSAADVRRVDECLVEGARLPHRLTQREVEVLRLVAAGKTNRDIAAELVVSQHTVARHLNNIFAKLGVSSRAAATAFAYTHDLVGPSA
jgi:ATP/maltotriose-dependent transcriptional regulator MalT